MKFVYGPKPENTRFRRAFTLLELLVVIMIIIVLAGITLRVTVFINRKMGENKSASELEKLKHAIVEYHAAYGVVPPVNRLNVMGDNQETMPWITTANVPNVTVPSDVTNFWQCYTGLAYYLWSPDFEPARQRWSDYIEDLMDPDGSYKSNRLTSGIGGSGALVTWTNRGTNCLDPWGQPYYYESFPPYQSFRLWSRGPDGVSGTPDDIGILWSE